MRAPLSLALLVALVCTGAGCSEPGEAPPSRVTIETSALRLEAGGVQVGAGPCGPARIPVCVVNDTDAPQWVRAPLAVVGGGEWTVEGRLEGPGPVEPGARRCADAVVARAFDEATRGEARVTLAGRSGPLAVVLEAPACGDRRVAAALSLTPFPEAPEACSGVETRACVRPTGDVPVRVEGVAVEGEAWRLSGVPAGPVWATPDAPVCFTLLGVAPAPGVHPGRLDVEISGLDEPLSRTLTFTSRDDGRYTWMDRFETSWRPEVDWVFVIDDAPAMGAARVGEALRSWADAMAAHVSAWDVRVAVTTTDPAYGGQPLVGPAGGPPVLSPDDPDFVERLVERAQLVRNPDTPAKAFEAAELSARRMGLRRDARLVVVLIGTEDDVSPGSVEAHATVLTRIKGERRRAWLVPAAITGESPDGCALPDGTHVPAGDRFQALVNGTGGGLLSICDPDWSARLWLWLPSGHRKARFFLSARPELGSIEVRVIDRDGVAQTVEPGDWTYDRLAVAIDFDPFHVPDPGDTVEVRYTFACPWRPLP